MALRTRAALAIPTWTARAALAFIGAWMLGHALVRVLETVNAWGRLYLAPTHLADGSWRSAEPLGDLPFRIEALLSLTGPLLLVAFVALGFALWPDPAGRRRFLVMFALFDALLGYLIFQGWDAQRPRSEMWMYLSTQLIMLPLVGLVVAMAWRSRTARGIAFGGAATLALSYAMVHVIRRGIPPGLPIGMEGFSALVLAMFSLRALAAIAFAAALLLASRAERPSPPSPASARPAAGSSPRAPHGR